MKEGVLMKRTFLYYCNAFAWRRDTTDPFYDPEKSQLFHIKGETPEIRDMMNEFSKVLDKDQSIFVIYDENFDRAIKESYIKPAIAEHDKQYNGKMIMGAHWFILWTLIMAFGPLYLFHMLGH